MYIFFNIMFMSSSHGGNAWPSCSWTNIITTDLVIWFMNASWTASWTTTSHGNTVSSDICESVILDFACRLEFVVSKSQGQATLDFTSDPQLTKNASWPRNQSFTMTWARWPVIAGISRYRPDHRYFNITAHGATVREQETSYLSAQFQSQSYLSVTHSTIVHEHSWYLLMIHLVISSPC